ncbi:uncharacterized protein LOC110605683 isoform X1 [Manihot esculenta]|uniref:YqgF/RNase H-like domain-containing protein n=1 Tax=Manihot esculenta TaxID=3983 RepID=A0A2C9U3Y8_MANES|nr:uncharacterized protein LOC110605683 isoform X1 [Manihot esculenta]OAY24380.1 hypothetical protein MANES_17G011000v8 [Manihot esculenta]
MCSIQSSFVPLMDFYSLSTYALPNLKNVPSFLRLPSPKACNHHSRLRAVLPIEEIPPNALRRKNDPQWRGGFSLGVDLGLSRTGLALSKGFSVRPLMVLELRGQKLELGLLEIAENEEVDEFIIGLPKSWDGKETPQSNKVRSVAGRLAVRAAERGWRVFLQDEHGTSTEATYRMINIWCWRDIFRRVGRELNLYYQSNWICNINFKKVLLRTSIFILNKSMAENQNLKQFFDGRMSTWFAAFNRMNFEFIFLFSFCWITLYALIHIEELYHVKFSLCDYYTCTEFVIMIADFVFISSKEASLSKSFRERNPLVFFFFVCFKLVGLLLAGPAAAPALSERGRLFLPCLVGFSPALSE